MILAPIEIPYLLAAAIALVAIEIITASFVLFWFGIGFLIVSGMSYFYPFEEGMVQLAWAFSIGVILMYLLRSKFVQYVMASKEKHIDAFEGEGEGIVQNGKIFFKGTYWESDVEGLREGQKVKVVKIDHGKAILK